VRPAARGPSALLCLGACAFLTSSCNRPRGPDTAAGVSWQLAQHRARTISDVRYDLSLNIPETLDDSITGTAVVRLRLADAAAPLVFDFIEPGEHILSVTVRGEPAAYDAVNDHLVIPPDELQVGENEIEIDFIAGSGALNRNEEFLYTLFVPDRARFAVPIFDQPNLKTRYSLTLNIPRHWVAVANGAEAAVEESGSGRTYRFSETKPLSTYLFAFAAGEFQIYSAERAGRRLRMFHRETDAAKVARNRDAIFDLHETALSWLEDYTGIPYPFEKFDFVLIPSFQYGGMEHPGGILYRAARLLLDESATQNDLLGRASLIAHETAHMWFGDLVTMNWFDDVWTKEVFANFMAAKIVNPSFPDVNHDLRFLLAHYPAAYEVDRTAGSNPIRQPLDNLNQAGSLYGAIIYQKAPVVMRHLEARVGETAFRDGLREYLRTYQFANASWPQLIEILDRLSPDELAAWSEVWIEQPDRPTITTHLDLADDGTIGSLRLVQSDPGGRDRIWPQRLNLLLSYPDTVRNIAVELDATETAVGDAKQLPAPDFILANGDGMGYGEFIPDSATLGYLASEVPNIDNELVRGIAWVTLWDAMLAERLAPRPLVQLALHALETENAELNTQRILGYMRTAYWRYLPASARAALAPEVESRVWDLLSQARSTSLKSAFFATYRSIAITETAMARLQGIWQQRLQIQGLPLSERDYTTLALSLAVREVPEWRTVLDQQADRIENPDRQAQFAFVQLAVSADPNARAAFFDSLHDPRNREHEPWVLEALSYLHHPLRAEESERFVLPSLELVEEIQQTGDIFFPLGWLNATLGGHNSATAAATVREFLDTRSDYPARLRGKILQAADRLFRSAEIVASGTVRN
jgi:aminopeptidase N